MPFLRWLARNKYRHIAEHTDEILTGTRDGTLKHTIRRRAHAAVRLNLTRATLLVVIILPAYATLIVSVLRHLGVADGLGEVVDTMASVSLAIGGLAGAGLWLVSRSLGILEADIYLMTMQEIMEQGSAAGG